MKSLLLALCLGFSLTLLSQNALQFSVYFDYDKHTIRDSESKTLNMLLDSLKKPLPFTLKLSGNTDADGSDAYNIALSERRVDAIRQYLAGHGIAKETMQTLALGEEKPIAENATERGKQQNRRVDIFLVWASQEAVAATPSVLERKFPFDKTKKYAINRLYKEFELPRREFDIINGEETIIKGDNGTVIKVPANAFAVPNDAKLKITLKEAYTFDAMIRENLTTMSGDKMLQTSGMVHIEATYEGQPITPKENLMVMMPNTYRVSARLENDPQNDMQFFQGSRNAKTNAMNWTVPEKPNFSFFFQSYNAVSQRIDLENRLREMTDTANCQTMFVWHIDSFYIRKAEREGDKSFLANAKPYIVSADKPHGYEFDHVQKDGLSPTCLKIAAWAAPEHSWYRKVPWKMKHQIFFSDIYQNYRATDYDSLLTAIHRYIRLNKEAEAALKVANTNMANGYFVFETKNLNWINCDRFLGLDADQLASIETDIENMPNIDAKIILKKSNSVMSANGGKSLLGFKNIPKGEEAIVVAMMLVNGESRYAMQKVMTEKGLKIKLKFRPLTPEEIAAEMKTL